MPTISSSVKRARNVKDKLLSFEMLIWAPKLASRLGAAVNNNNIINALNILLVGRVG